MDNGFNVADETEYSFPSVPGIYRGFSFSMRKYVGFRLNDEPLPQLPLDNIAHRYQIEVGGTGNPLKFQILDSVYSIPDEEVQPRYSDNRGSLRITVEEITEKVDVNICDVEVREISENYIALRLNAGIFILDTSCVCGLKNLLEDISQLGIVENGRFICPDSLKCEGTIRDTLAIVFVLDKSGSMDEPVSMEILPSE